MLSRKIAVGKSVTQQLIGKEISRKLYEVEYSWGSVRGREDGNKAWGSLRGNFSWGLDWIRHLNCDMGHFGLGYPTLPRNVFSNHPYSCLYYHSFPFCSCNITRHYLEYKLQTTKSGKIIFMKSVKKLYFSTIDRWEYVWY